MHNESNSSLLQSFAQCFHHIETLYQKSYLYGLPYMQLLKFQSIILDCNLVYLPQTKQKSADKADQMLALPITFPARFHLLTFLLLFEAFLRSSLPSFASCSPILVAIIYIFRKPAAAPRKNKRIIIKEVPNFRSRYIPKKEQPKIGTIIFIPNCDIVVRERNEFFLFFTYLPPFASIVLLYPLFLDVSSKMAQFFMVVDGFFC